jgi:hypothetical protein
MNQAEPGKRKAEPTAAVAHEGAESNESSDLRLPASSVEKPPLTDSPWFWLALFGIFGLAAMLAIGPKYALRQGGIETRFQNRQVAGQWQGEAIESADAVAATRLPASVEERPLLISLRPLFVGLGVLVAGIILVVVWRSRHGGQAAPLNGNRAP